MSVRSQLEATLKPLLPKRWKLIPYQDNVDELETTTVMFKLLRMENATETPISAFKFTFAITVVEPGNDMVKVEAALDDHVEDLWQLLEKKIPWTKPTLAEKVGFGDPVTNIGFDITTEALFEKQ